MNPVITFLTGLIPWPEQFFKYHDTILNSEVMKNLPLTIITISLVTGFTEEFLFRGIVMTRLKRICNSTLTVIISALIFSAIHGDPISFLGIFIIGVLLGVVFLKYDSVIPCMIIHAAFNLFAILGFPSNHPLFVLGFVLTCAAVSLGMGYILLRKPTKANSFAPHEDSVSENENVTE
jgi:membrane protease YdiL (CAAX protease family)